MKRCQTCGQLSSQRVSTCPACGSSLVDGIRFIDDYRIQAIIHEGRSSIVCKALKAGSKNSVSIRIFTQKSGVDDAVALRLEKELSLLKTLPEEHFVQHFALRKSREGYWYRISEWVNASDWGSIFMSGLLNDQRRIVTLFRNIASVMALLHKRDHFMPYLILDDILIPEKKLGRMHVKVNYKLSRFLNARATHHSPMLKKLLGCHPDILNDRAINFKSDIWSMGKLFVELLTADHNLTDFSSKVDEIKGLHPELKTLLKIMLAEDPDLRPKSMDQIAETLSHILDSLPYGNGLKKQSGKRSRLVNELHRLKKTVTILTVLVLLVTTVSAGSWIYLHFGKNRPENTLAKVIESHTGSVAFLMVEYWLKESGQTVYRNKVEGTAFLVDQDGYFLTNRHVACPWLEDTTLFQAYHQYNTMGKSVEFDHRLYLWFEGAKAFNRLPALRESSELSDAYYLASAYRSGGRGNLRIAGVPRTSTKTGEMMKSPFKNDFAVLKIDDQNLSVKPLPLYAGSSSEKIKRLSPVIILGFPLGKRTQGDHINTSITRGHVRRTSGEIIQVDSSIYKGNSGGPAIDNTGQVIGIASGVITDQINEYLKVTTPLSDFGLILPIEGPAQFVSAIKRGQPKWDGRLDFGVESKLEKIIELAMEHRFEDAARLSETLNESSSAPALLYAAGMMQFCALDFDRSRTHFKELAQVENRNATSWLMLYIIDWIKSNERPGRKANRIFNMAWYEEDEFLGYLAGVLEQQKDMKTNFIEYENSTEKSWRLFIEGLIAEKNDNLDHAYKMFEHSVLSAGANDWVYYLSFSRLGQVQKVLAGLQEDKKAYQKRMDAFKKEAREERKSAVEHRSEMASLILEFESDRLSRDEKVSTYTRLLELAPDNRTIIGRIAFFHAAQSEWDSALDFIDLYFKLPSRETALSLSLSLLKGEILRITGPETAAAEYLGNLLDKTADPWYRIIIKQLLSGPSEKTLTRLAGKKPEKLITLHTALGLWAEGENNIGQATHHYREALGSYLDDWNEYDLALERILHLRQTAD